MSVEPSVVLQSALGIDPVAAHEVRVLALVGYGLNCEAETAAGFSMLGARVDQVHVSDVLERGGADLAGHHILVFIGGFSFGDHIASGRVYANRLRYRLGDRLGRFVDDGGLCLGICNGFQTMAKMGLVPALDREPGEALAAQTASLVGNDRLGYYNGWVRLAVDPDSPCVFTRDLHPGVLEFPSRHGEGKLIFADEDVARTVEDAHLIPVRYVDEAGEVTQTWPHNPNGSPAGAAGLCDRTGRVFGLMPHPEAFLYRENHPHWRSAPGDRAAGVAMPDPAPSAPPTNPSSHSVTPGLRLLANGVRAAVGAG